MFANIRDRAQPAPSAAHPTCGGLPARILRGARSQCPTEKFFRRRRRRRRVIAAFHFQIGVSRGRPPRRMPTSRTKQTARTVHTKLSIIVDLGKRTFKVWYPSGLPSSHRVRFKTKREIVDAAAARCPHRFGSSSGSVPASSTLRKAAFPSPGWSTRAPRIRVAHNAHSHTCIFNPVLTSRKCRASSSRRKCVDGAWQRASPACISAVKVDQVKVRGRRRNRRILMLDDDAGVKRPSQ